MCPGRDRTSPAQNAKRLSTPRSGPAGLAGDEQRDAFAGPVRGCILKALRQAINDDRTDRTVRTDEGVFVGLMRPSCVQPLKGRRASWQPLDIYDGAMPSMHRPGQRSIEL